MSGRLRMRLGTLEKRVRADGACKLCGGKTQAKLLIGEEEPAPGPCPRCGRAPIVIRIIRGEPPPEWEERRRAAENA